MAWMGYREYARHRGCRLYAVQKAITTGRIAAAVNAERKEIDSAAADQLWALATDQAMQRGEPVAAPAALPILDGVLEAAPSTLSARPVWDVPLPPADPNFKLAPSSIAARGVVVDGETFQEWRTREQRANALAAERELAKQDRALLDAGEVLKTFTAIGRMYAAGRDGVPAQLAPRLVGLTDVAAIERLLRAAYRESDLRIAHEIRNQFAEVAGDAVAAG